MIKPNRILNGDTIGIISPASTPDDLSRIEKATRYFNSKGFEVKVGKNVGKYFGFLAGTNEERIHDIHTMFADKSVTAVFCLRGGYGSGRLLDQLDYELIRNNPKVFIGYSDITVMHSAFLTQSELVSFAGPMAGVDFWNIVDPYTEKCFWDIVSNPQDTYCYPLPENCTLNALVKGEAEGILYGGNLALLTSIMGTKYFPDLTRKILYIEDVGEEPYRIDRMLNQLKLAGAFEQVNGIIVGQFSDCDPKEPAKSFTKEEVIHQYLSGLAIPVLLNFPHGHVPQTATMPHGVKARLNTDDLTLTLLELAVR